MIKIDKPDSKILEALVQNSRLPLTKLCKFAHLSRENAHYRLNRLMKLGVVKSLNAIVNTELLGFKQNSLFLQLNKINKQKENQIISVLKNHKSISWIGLLTGRWSLAIDIYARNEEELARNLHEILNICGNHIGEYALLPIEVKEYFIYKVINLKPKNSEIKHPIIRPKMDKINFRIIEMLNANSRTTYAELSKYLKLTANAIKKRIKLLEKEKIILGYSSLLNHKSLGYEWYGLQLKLIKFDDKSIEDFIKYLREHPKVIFYYKYVSGFWNFDLGVLVKESSELRDFINELRDKFAETIKINDSFLLLEEITENVLPKIMFL